jgi:hypothetical protein
VNALIGGGWDEGKPPPRRASAYDRLANRLRGR